MREFVISLIEAIPWLLVVGIGFYFAARGEMGKSLRVDEIALATLGLVSGIALAQLLDRLRVIHRIDQTVQKIHQDLPLRAVTGLAKFNKSREESSGFSYRIQAARKEIFIAGGALVNTVTNYGQLLIRKADEGCKVRLLLMNPRTRDGGERNPVAIPMSENYEYPDFCGAIESTLRDLEHLLSRASERAKRNVEIRLYNAVQTLSLMIIDDDENAKTGWMIVELLLYRQRVAARPSLEFTQSHELFGAFKYAYSHCLWENSIVWFPKSGSKEIAT